MLHRKSVRENEALVISGPSTYSSSVAAPEILRQRGGGKWVLGCGIHKVARIPLCDITVQLQTSGAWIAAEGVKVNLKAVAKVLTSKCVNFMEFRLNSDLLPRFGLKTTIPAF